MLSVVLLCIDLSLLPMILAWNVPLTDQFHFYTLFGVVFWTADMVLGFFTGYETDDGVELEVRQTALHYLRTRFTSDFVVVLCDWAAVVVGQLDVEG